MKKELLALCFIAALPACGCLRKSGTKSEKPKKAMTDKKMSDTKDMTKKAKGAAKTHMDYGY